MLPVFNALHMHFTPAIVDVCGKDSCVSSSAVSHCISSVLCDKVTFFFFFSPFFSFNSWLFFKNQPLYQSLGCDAFEPWQVNVTLMLKCGD